ARNHATIATLIVTWPLWQMVTLPWYCPPAPYWAFPGLARSFASPVPPITANAATAHTATSEAIPTRVPNVRSLMRVPLSCGRPTRYRIVSPRSQVRPPDLGIVGRDLRRERIESPRAGNRVGAFALDRRSSEREPGAPRARIPADRVTQIHAGFGNVPESELGLAHELPRLRRPWPEPVRAGRRTPRRRSISAVEEIAGVRRCAVSDVNPDRRDGEQDRAAEDEDAGGRGERARRRGRAVSNECDAE